MPEFTHPSILLVPPAIGLALLWLRLRSPRVGARLSTPSVQVAARRGARVASRLPVGLRGATIVALSVVVGGPFVTRLLPGDPAEGVAIVVALDVSESMTRLDPRLGRKLDAALQELGRFVTTRRGDRVGLVTFAGEALARVPPILDRAPLLAAARTVKGDALEDGTALGTAIAVAANRLRKIDARSRVLVLMTDGESNAGALDPLSAARAAAAVGVRIYTVGLGVEGEDVLRRIARVGGGLYFAAEDREGLDRAYREIDALEPSTFSSGGGRTERLPRHAGLLWLAAVLVAVESGLRASRFGRLP